MATLPFYFITDVETGGLKSKEHAITEVAVLIANGTTLAPQTTFQTYVKPYHGLTITQEVLNHSGVSMSDVASGMEAKELVAKLIELAKVNKVGRYGLPILVGHNLQGFDIDFYALLFDLHGKNLYDYFSRETQDTLGLSRLCWGADKEDDVKRFKLEMCCQRAGIKLTNAHSALNDTKATHKLFRYLINRMRSNGAPTLVEEQEQKPRKAFKF